MSELGVRRDKAALSSGFKSPPATAPADGAGPSWCGGWHFCRARETVALPPTALMVECQSRPHRSLSHQGRSAIEAVLSIFVPLYELLNSLRCLKAILLNWG